MGFKTTLKLITLAALMASCTEQVSNELNSSLSSSSSSSDDLSESGMRLTHTMDENMSFYMHKAGTVNVDCEITPPTSDGFDASTYYKDPSMGTSAQVVDCILEAQEQDLYFNGAGFKLEVDEQLCEYVRYRPFRFIEAQYGNTAKTVYKINCTSDESECSTGGFCDNYYDNYAGGVADGANLTNQLSEDQLVCQFDYESKIGNDKLYGQNCDEGTITYLEYTIDNTPYDHDSNSATDDICPSTANNYTPTYDYTTTDECGGDHLNCIGGPAVDLLGEYTAEMHSNVDLGTFEKEWSVEAPADRVDTDSGSNLYSNMYVANFSRICSSSDAGVLKDEAAFSNYGTLELEGHDLENLRSAFGSNTYSTVTDAGGETDYYAYAENPWRAVHYTNPYYSFECLDQARDVKAQIRLFIRDWDRNFDETSSALINVTDGASLTPLMDNYGSHDGEYWNDIRDWDDFFGNGTVWNGNTCTDATDPFSVEKVYIDTLADPDPVFPGNH